MIAFGPREVGNVNGSLSIIEGKQTEFSDADCHEDGLRAMEERIYSLETKSTHLRVEGSDGT